MTTPADQSTKPTYCLAHHDASTVASVYVIGLKQHPEFVKIGIANDPDTRVMDLQLANPFTLEVVVQRRVCCKTFARKIERRLHHRYRDQAHGREWFNLPLDPRADLLHAMMTGEVENW